ncbi:phosphotransferase family protein [Gordonia hydrophobica]|uniref:Phosphotransferase family protein n=1 Tax=Gordonia hydrophobica TaxID=40516 RepID=A0ABZ2TZP8_9ACTN|nr:phosphotransferase family protein [Gordonia hydrophobica]MBM7368816.1 aminoglycoside phosphotransferase (APT) family kinase protein [Gordonia hydrophobica]
MEDPEDHTALARWLDDVGAPGNGETPVIERLTGGSQNELFRVTREGIDGVLRMPPASADSARLDGLRRELRLLSALKGSDVPHAELIAGEPTGDVLGSPFYLMKAIDGWSPTARWAPPFDTDLEARSELAFELVGGIAQLSKVDWRNRGLTGFGHPENFHDRQVDRWLAFLGEYRFRELPGLDTAAEWLRNNRPTTWSPGIMHGDYQFANVMFAHGAPAELAAIIDWEMTTIGDPLLDLAWALLGWDGETPRTDFYVDLEGMPKRSALTAHYEKISGRSTADLHYYLVLANWKLGVVLEKSYAALVKGDRADDKIETFGPLILDLIATAADLTTQKESA